MRNLTGSSLVILIASLAVGQACHAQEPASIVTQANDTDRSAVNIGGLSLAPDAYRYRPRRNVLPSSDNSQTLYRPAAHRLSSVSDDLDAAYVTDRQSLLNSIRARRGFSLLTFWENADRCLFFGLNDKGQPGLNFVRTRQLVNTSERPDNETERLYAQLMQLPRATFPTPPGVGD